MRVPLQPPDAVQEVALVDDQLSVEALPLETLVGLAASVTGGAGAGAGVGAGVPPVAGVGATCCPPPHAVSTKAVMSNQR